MNHEKTRERDVQRLLQQGEFRPAGEDSAFLGTVRMRVKGRRRRRSALTTAASSLTAVLLVLMVFGSGGLFQQGYTPQLTDGSWTTTGFSEDELISLNDNLDQFYLADESADSTTQKVTSELSWLFDEGPIDDPVDYLAQYDDEIQERVLKQLEQLNILDLPVNHTGEREEI